MLREILIKSAPTLVKRCEITPYGAASAGFVLGKMVSDGRFRRPTCVFVDGDQERREGCYVLPGNEAPERVVFSSLKEQSWPDLATLLSRDFSSVADACSQAMTYDDHHEWVKLAANKLLVSGDILWHQMCAAWAQHCLSTNEASAIALFVQDALSGI